MVLECMSLLTEATLASDVYAKYYKDKIPEELWNTLMNGTLVITPFHQTIANLMVTLLSNKSVRFRSSTEKLVQEIAQTASQAWNKGKDVQQFLYNTVKDKHVVYENHRSTLRFLRWIINGGFVSDSQVEKIDNGIMKLYEDENLLVTCTMSYSASHKYYGDSHWCTASGIDGRYSGYDMFDEYVEPDEDEKSSTRILVQFVDKRDRTKSYQMSTEGYLQAAGNLSYDDLMDFYDNRADLSQLFTQFGTDPMKAAIKSLCDNFENLSKLTFDFDEKEYEYYRYKTYKYVLNNSKALIAKINSQEFINNAVDELAALNLTAKDIDSKSWFETDSFWYDNDYDYDKTYSDYLILGVCANRSDSEESFRNKFFNLKEISVMARSFSFSSPQFYTLKNKKLFIFKKDNISREGFIGAYDYVSPLPRKGVVGHLVRYINNQDTHGFINLRTGEEFFSITTGDSDGKMFLIKGSVLLNDKKTFSKGLYNLIAKKTSENTAILKFAIGPDGFVEKLNIPISRWDDVDDNWAVVPKNEYDNYEVNE